MDCATVCLLTAAVGFARGPDTTQCSYCIDARSTYEDCFSNILECAYRDPESLIICNNIYEQSGDLIHHSLRCLSYKQFYISDKDIHKLGDHGMCSYNQVQKCDCELCPMPPPPPNTTTTEAPTRPTPSILHHSHHHHKGKTHKIRSESNRNEALMLQHDGTVSGVSAYREGSSTTSATNLTLLPLIYLILQL